MDERPSDADRASERPPGSGPSSELEQAADVVARMGDATFLRSAAAVVLGFAVLTMASVAAGRAIIAATGSALIALEGSHGTLSEMALGLKMGRPVIALGRRENPPGVLVATDPEEAVRMALGG